MANFDELQEWYRQSIIDLRTSTGKTKEEMAEIFNVSYKTYLRYESGESAPTGPEYLYAFSSLRRDGMRIAMDFLYPDVYRGLSDESQTDEMKKAITHYVNQLATIHEVRGLNYLLFGGHGSAWRAQLDEFLMIDHLPMHARPVVAAVVYELYQLHEKLGTLIGNDAEMPDIQHFVDAYIKGREASHRGEESYTI